MRGIEFELRFFSAQSTALSFGWCPESSSLSGVGETPYKAMTNLETALDCAVDHYMVNCGRT